MDWRIHLGNLLALKNKWQTSEDKKRYFMVHIPKTAGTTFRYLLYQEFAQDEIFSNKAMIKANDGRYLRFPQFKELSEQEQAKYRLVYGHFSFMNGAHLPFDYQMMTFLREPVARVISNIRHVMTYDKSLEGMSAEEVYETRAKGMNNIQVRYLKRGGRAHFLNKKIIQTAKDNLQKCVFFGITERFEESIILAQKTFNWNLTPIGGVNKTKLKNLAISSKLIEQIRSANAADIELYNYGIQLFEQRLKGEHIGT